MRKGSGGEKKRSRKRRGEKRQKKKRLYIHANQNFGEQQNQTKNKCYSVPSVNSNIYISFTWKKTEIFFIKLSILLP